MNFTPFVNHIPGSIPTATVHQFATAKFAHNVATAGGQVVGLLSGGEGGVHFLRPIDPNGFTLTSAQPGSNQEQQTVITLPISIAGKPGEHDQHQQMVQIQVVNPNATLSNDSSGNNIDGKCHISPLSFHHLSQGVLTVAYSGHGDGETVQLQVPQIQLADASENPSHSQGNSDIANNNTQTQSQSTLQQTITMSTADKHTEQQAFPVTVVAHLPQELILRDAVTAVDVSKVVQSREDGRDKDPLQISLVKAEEEKDSQDDFNESVVQTTTLAAVPATWPAGPTVVDYLSRLQGSSLPLSLHQFLKFSADTIKREATVESSPLSNTESTEVTNAENAANSSETGNGKQKRRKKYKKPPKPRRPRPGQVHIATALDGTTLFCCPECHMAYPDKDMLEQHLVGHKIERRFICDICGAGLKRKEHLERHKLGHNPDRPFICTVCHKGFKRKEHLNLHSVIHSGQKTEVCTECGKGFYRKDHLRKHARSHIAKRIKEHNQQLQQLQQLQQQQLQLPQDQQLLQQTQEQLQQLQQTQLQSQEQQLQQSQELHQAQEQIHQSQEQIQHTQDQQLHQQSQEQIHQQSSKQLSQQSQEQSHAEHIKVEPVALVTTVVLPTAAETGAMLLQHHSSH